MTPRGVVPVSVATVRPRLGRAWQDWRAGGRRRAAAEALADAVQVLVTEQRLPPGRWAVQRLLATETDVTVALLGPTNGRPLAVGRITEPGADDADLTRNTAVLGDLRADARLGDWRSVLPVPLASGRYRDRGYAVESFLPGTEATSWLDRRALIPPLVDAAATAIGVLHRSATSPAVVDDAVLHHWVERPLAVLHEVAARRDATPAPAALRRLRRHLDEALRGRPYARARTHGDYWLGNLLVHATGRDLAGIVDWGAARADGLPLQDLHHLLLTTRAAIERAPLGQVVAAAREGRLWSDAERRLLAAAGWCWSTGRADEPALVLVTWLDHVASVLAKRPAYRGDSRWLGRVVDPVLRTL